MKTKFPRKGHLLVLAMFSLTASATLAQAPLPPAGPAAPRKQPAKRPRPEPPLMRPASPVAPKFGDPLPGLSAKDLAAFTTGFGEFSNAESIEGGLGPIFNNVSCISCHGAPSPGGGSAITVTRFGKLTGSTFDPLDSLGGSLQQLQAIHPAALEIVPLEANVTAQRQSTALYGMGLVEAIPDSVLVAAAAKRQPDGVHGRVHWIKDIVSGTMRVGRFGWKAQQATVLAFSADAYINEMGVTNRFFPTENAPNGNAALLAEHDHVEDPEDTVDPATGKADIDIVADYMRFLGAPPTLPATPRAQNGRSLFNLIGCAVCHTPSLQSGASPTPSIAFKNVPLYSDLLLHDMGSLADGIAQGQAGTRDFKTPPLWGVRSSAPYLHDGRAANLEAAIRAHDGEGAVAKNRYAALTNDQRAMLTEFLNTL